MQSIRKWQEEGIPVAAVDKSEELEKKKEAKV